MGFFDLFKKKVSTDAAKAGSKVENFVKKTVSEVVNNGPEDEEALRARVKAAQEKFKQDQDLEAVMKELEYAYWKAKPALKSSKCMDLVTYYLQAEKPDSAREYLNFLKEQNDRPAEEYRLAEAKILKSESKWTEAICQYMLGYLVKAERTGKLQEDKLQNDIRSSVKKQGWSENTVKELTNLLKKHINKKDFKVESLEADIMRLVAKLA